MISNLFYYIFGFLVLVSLYFDVGKTKSKKLYKEIFNITYVFLALLVAFRYGTGIDTPGYMNSFNIMPNLSELQRIDFIIYRVMPGYIILVAFVKSIFGEFVFLQIIQALLFYCSYYLLIQRLNLKKFYLLLAFYGYVYFAELSGIRECLGLAFIFWGLQYYLDRKYVGYYTFVILAILMHSGMFVFLLLPLVRVLKKLTGHNLLIIVGFFTAIILLFDSLKNIIGLLNDGSVGRYANSESGGLGVVALVASIIQLWFVYTYAIKKNKNETHIDFIYLGAVAILISAMSGMMPILYRYTSHFTIFYFYTANKIFSNLKRLDLLSFIFAFLFFYSPTTRFFSSMASSPRLQYCSVFASKDDKKFFNKEINATGIGDIFREE